VQDRLQAEIKTRSELIHSIQNDMEHRSQEELVSEFENGLNKKLGPFNICLQESLKTLCQKNSVVFEGLQLEDILEVMLNCVSAIIKKYSKPLLQKLNVTSIESGQDLSPLSPLEQLLSLEPEYRAITDVAIGEDEEQN
jgi:hypothetical protein